MENYQEIHARHQKEVNELPLHFAFGQTQQKNLLAELGLTEEIAKEKLCTMGGAIVLKSDSEKIAETFTRHHKELEKAMENVEFLKSAFMYEMGNHEYQINAQGAYDVLCALGFDCEYEHELDCLTENQKKIWEDARKEYWDMCIENDWF